jgi:hypothetical protein
MIDRDIELKKTKYTIPFVLAGKIHEYTALQTHYILLKVIESDPKAIVFQFDLTRSLTGLVDGAQELNSFRANIERFEKLDIRDDYVITGIKKFISTNPIHINSKMYIRVYTDRSTCYHQFEVSISMQGSTLWNCNNKEDKMLSRNFLHI